MKRILSVVVMICCISSIAEAAGKTPAEKYFDACNSAAKLYLETLKKEKLFSDASCQVVTMMDNRNEIKLVLIRDGWDYYSNNYMERKDKLQFDISPKWEKLFKSRTGYSTAPGVCVMRQTCDPA